MVPPEVGEVDGRLDGEPEERGEGQGNAKREQRIQKRDLQVRH